MNKLAMLIVAFDRLCHPLTAEFPLEFPSIGSNPLPHCFIFQLPHVPFAPDLLHKGGECRSQNNRDGVHASRRRELYRRLNWASEASVSAMADDHSHVPRAKARSASICASSLEALPGGLPNGGTPQSRRRKPAARSQSARLNNNRSIKRRTTLATNQIEVKGHCNSEPKLDQGATPEVSPNIKRKGSRRGTSVYHRKSTAFLDVPDTRAATRGNPDEEDEDSYRLRSFSFTSKGKIARQMTKINYTCN